MSDVMPHWRNIIHISNDSNVSICWLLSLLFSNFSKCLLFRMMHLNKHKSWCDKTQQDMRITLTYMKHDHLNIQNNTFLANQCCASTVNQTFIFTIKNFIENSNITNFNQPMGNTATRLEPNPAWRKAYSLLHKHGFIKHIRISYPPPPHRAYAKTVTLD